MKQVQRVLSETGRSSQRKRDLPAHVMVYYVIALALYRAEGSREVLRLLLEGLQMLLGGGFGSSPQGNRGSPRHAAAWARSR